MHTMELETPRTNNASSIDACKVEIAQLTQALFQAEADRDKAQSEARDNASMLESAQAKIAELEADIVAMNALNKSRGDEYAELFMEAGELREKVQGMAFDLDTLESNAKIDLAKIRDLEKENKEVKAEYYALDEERSGLAHRVRELVRLNTDLQEAERARRANVDAMRDGQAHDALLQAQEALKSASTVLAGSLDLLEAYARG